MARFNEILSGRFNRALQKLFSMKGDPPAPQLASEIMPVLPMFYGVECRYLEGWNRFSAALAQAGGAAQNSAIRWRLPQNTGVLAVMEKIQISNPTAAAFVISVRVDPNGIQVDLPVAIAAASVTTFDSRGSLTPVAVVSSSTNFGAGPTPTLGITSVPPGATVDVILTDDQELSLISGPSSNGGPAVTLFCNTANVQFNVTFMWRERVIEESEKNLGGGGVG